MEKRKVKVATVFSGIGAFEQALEKMNIPYDIIFACDNGEREIKVPQDDIKKYIEENNLTLEEQQQYIKRLYDSTKKENYMKTSYKENYKIPESKWYEDIRFIDGKNYENEVDFLVGGSPCQSFSIIGKRAGLEDARGTLFYEFARLIKEIQPKVFIYENVTGMLTHDKGKTWNIILDIFSSLGYRVYSDILNSMHYGIPQNRKRLFVVGFKDVNTCFDFPNQKILEKTMFDFLEEDVDSKYYLGKKGFEFVTNPKYKARARVNREIIQTQKANQQFNWNGDFVFEPLSKVQDNSKIMERAHVGEFEGEKGVIRQLTNRECLRLMGFSDNFKIVVPDVWAYRQAGNSIVVNVLESIVKEIMKVVNFYEN